ncbi:NAD-dependent epimerase/dehydratase family protein [Chlorobaculum sp. 24CR]|uniref:NAD-dependent epimerase/dehydratase family protein n=1 Tax=Chlorobaculum sp. 24CR TaxID=2508878 RepID=UPI00100C1378|nr:NAD-dependent epimerase/dehydratase family protein [Chlorobaculum sp. 24CR]RXK89434.1 NAD-dependent epimerase/dehydratase family protein [Chlorobaculum sp. 24CR]
MSEVILVTGSTGFIGSRMVDTLIGQGRRVRVLLRPESRATSPSGRRAGVEEVRAAYGDAEALGRAVSGVASIIHLAGVTKAVDEAGFIAGNVTPTENLLEAVRRRNPGLRRFLLVSSLAAMGPATSPSPGVRESDRPRPVSAYGRSKLLGEEAARRHVGGVPLTIVRPPAVYGPGDRDILEVFAMMKKGYLLSAGSGTRQRFSMIHVDELIEGTLLALRSEAAAGQDYFITSPRGYAWDEVIEAARPVLGFRRLMRINLPKPLVFALGAVLGAVAKLTARPALINRDKARELVQDFWVCSPQKAERELGFTAAIPLAEGVAETLRWYRQQGWL